MCWGPTHHSLALSWEFSCLQCKHSWAGWGSSSPLKHPRCCGSRANSPSRAAPIAGAASCGVFEGAGGAAHWEWGRIGGQPQVGG